MTKPYYANYFNVQRGDYLTTIDFCHHGPEGKEVVTSVTCLNGDIEALIGVLIKVRDEHLSKKGTENEPGRALQ